MGLRISTNISSITAQRHLQQTTSTLGKHLEKLSSGFRINCAADDAAGLAISQKMNASSRSLRQAKRNALDGISLVQTAEGGLSEISNILSRLRELSVQAASDTIGNLERQYLQKEFGSLKDEIDRIAWSSDFNGTKLLVGETQLPEVYMDGHNKPPQEIQVGANFSEETDGVFVASPVNIIRADLSKINALTYGDGSLNLSSQDPEAVTSVDTKKHAQLTIGMVDIALDRVNSYRSNLGSIQNRLTSAINNLTVQVENLDSTKSRIKDSDYAEETAIVTQQGILQQAGIAVLSQANKMPELALKLLQG